MEIEEEIRAEINNGLLVFVGISKFDTHADIEYVVDKVINLRVFPDNNGKFHFSLKDSKDQLMVISQFTLYGDTRKGRRPSFSDSMEPVSAEKLFNEVVDMFKAHSGLEVKQGQFGSHMNVQLINDGPVTIWLDSEDRRLPRNTIS